MKFSKEITAEGASDWDIDALSVRRPVPTSESRNHDPVTPRNNTPLPCVSMGTYANGSSENHSANDDEFRTLTIVTGILVSK